MRLKLEFSFINTNKCIKMFFLKLITIKPWGNNATEFYQFICLLFAAVLATMSKLFAQCA